jgi:hypothetical protein
MAIQQVSPKVGDTINGNEVLKVEDYGHDTAMRYVFAHAEPIYAAHWDFVVRSDIGSQIAWALSRKWYSGWASD